jgi:hypothetical protein
VPRLFDPALHTLLGDARWDEAEAGEACDRIVAEALASFDPEMLWPCHPRDAEADDAPRPRGYTSLYLGAAGTAWALQRLTGRSPIGADELTAAFAAAPDLPGMTYGLLLGDAGAALVAHRPRPDPGARRPARDGNPRRDPAG